MPDPKTYKQHFENKHPKNELPADLKDVWNRSNVLLSQYQQQQYAPTFTIINQAGQLSVIKSWHTTR